MSYTVLLTNFEGPLELLLKLIEREQLDITDITLSQVTADYLGHMQQLNLEPADLNWFIEIATKLIDIKTAMLIPQTDDEAEENGADLAKQLQTYRIYRDLAIKLGELGKQPSYGRPYRFVDIQPDLPLSNLTPDSLEKNYRKLIDGLEGSLQPPQPIIKKITLSQTVRKLELILNNTGAISLAELLKSAQNKREEVLFFLAALEMLKQSRLLLKHRQPEHEDITLELAHA